PAWPWCDSLPNWVAACAKKRRLLTARGISASRASFSGLPPSRDSARAKSSRRASSAAASFSSQPARTSLGSADQAGKAARAADTAASTSARFPRATSAKGWPLAGSKTSIHPPPAGSRGPPSIPCVNRIGAVYPRGSDRLHPAAVHGQAHAVDVARRGRAQEGDDAADLLRPRETPGRHGLAHALGDLGLRPAGRLGPCAHQPFDAAGVGEAGQHVVDGDAERRDFARQGL